MSLTYRSSPRKKVEMKKINKIQLWEELKERQQSVLRQIKKQKDTPSFCRLFLYGRIYFRRVVRFLAVVFFLAVVVAFLTVVAVVVVVVTVFTSVAGSL